MMLREMSSNLWVLLETGAYVLLLLAGCGLIRLLDRRDRRLWALAVAMGLDFLLLVALNTGCYQLLENRVGPVLSVVLDTPVWIPAAVLVLGFGGVLGLLWEDLRFRRRTVTRAAVKESLDNLPTGLCFSDRHGAVLLSNRRMQTLCHQVTGAELQDGDWFWTMLAQGTLVPGAERLQTGEDVLIRLEDGTVWSFRRSMIRAEDEDVAELSAADATDLYRLTCQLRANNRALAEMNARLKQYNTNVDALVRSRERLETKIRIHDDFGQALLATRYLLSREEEGTDLAGLLGRWRGIVSVLRREAEPERSAGDWEALTAAAAASGVQVVLTGALPTEEPARSLLLGATAEALTNAVRHGDATELYLSVTGPGRYWQAVFTNNGKAPAGPITLGGGLSALEGRLLEAGGTLSVAYSPAFALTVTIPQEGGAYHDPCPDR